MLFRCNAEPFGHFLVEESAARAVGLYPFSIDDELGYGALADMMENFLRRTGRYFNIDLCVGDTVLIEKTFCLAAIAAPGGRVEKQLHDA